MYTNLDIKLLSFYYKFYMLGGDPAAGSPTATLLRLHPPQKT